MGLSDWKLKLRYSKTKTPYKHYTLLADCFTENLSEDYDCPTDNAVVSLKIWALDGDQAAQIFQDIGEQVGYSIKNKIEIYDTPAGQPPEDKPTAYDMKFTPYDSDHE